MTPAQASVALGMAAVAAAPRLGALADEFSIDLPRGPTIPDDRQLEFQQAFMLALLDACPADIKFAIIYAFELAAGDPVEGPKLWPKFSAITAPHSAKFKRALILSQPQFRGGDA